MKRSDETRQKTSVIRCRSRYIAGEEYVYKLKRESSGDNYGYGISIEGTDDTSECYAGNERRRASALFRRVCDGQVTPCTLKDVVEDYFG